MCIFQGALLSDRYGRHDQYAGQLEFGRPLPHPTLSTRSRILPSTIRPLYVTAIAALLVSIVVGLGYQATAATAASTAVVHAAAETDPVHHSGDAADDIAVWVHPTSPSKSLIIGTDKRGGLALYDMSGAERQFISGFEPNNVDLRQGFTINGVDAALIAISEAAGDTVEFFTVDEANRRLKALPGVIDPDMGASGLCMYRSSGGTTEVFVGDSSGNVQQWRLSWSNGAVQGTLVRRLDFASVTEGCVADDTLGWVYFAEEARGIWRLGADAGDGTNRALVAKTVGNGGAHLVADVEGLALYQTGANAGYLVASSQGSDEFVVLDRQPPHEPLGVFRVNADTVDGVSHTDGIEATSSSLGGSYGAGAFISQDDVNGNGNQNFKLVPWDRVSTALGLEANEVPPPPPPPPGDGKTYYVDATAGNDSRTGRSPSKAWKTLDRVNSVTLEPGDAVLLKRGSVWNERLRILNSGEAGGRIVVSPYGSGRKPKIRGASTCVEVEGDYVTIRKLAIKGCSWAGVGISGQHNVLKGNWIGNNVAGVYLKGTAQYNKVTKNRLMKNDKMIVLTENKSNDDSGAFGVLIHGDHNEVSYNSIDRSAALSYDYGMDGAAIEIYGGSDNYIHHNTARDNDVFAELGEPGTDDNVFAFNAVTSDLEDSVFLVARGSDSGRGPVDGTVAHHNSVYMTGQTSQGFVCYAGCDSDSLSLRNNIIKAVWKVGYADGPIDTDYNIFSGGNAQFEMGSHSIFANPRWVDPGSGDLHLRPASSAVDSGKWLGYNRDLDGTPLPVDGDESGSARVDRGAYEYTP